MDNIDIWLGYHQDDCPLNRKFIGFFFDNHDGQKIQFEATSFKDIVDNFALMGFNAVAHAIPSHGRVLVEAQEAGMQISLK